MFSIIIPSYNNLSYLKICIESIKKNSKYNHQIIVHVNSGEDGTKEYLDKAKIDFTWTNENVGLCKAVNLAAKKSINNYIVYSHDDFYFCPSWDEFFYNEIKNIGHENFYLSGTMFHEFEGKKLFCGENSKNFNEKILLDNYKKINFPDFQGSTWAPHIVHKNIWNKVGGFSEEFFPGAGSDPDFAMKLWNEKVRIFKGLGKCLVYHFGSKTLRNKLSNDLKENLGSHSSKVFLKKWKVSANFFKIFYLKSGVGKDGKQIFNKYDGPLKEPKKNITYFYKLFINRLKYMYLKLIYFH